MTTTRFFHFAIALLHFEGPQSGDHCLLVLEQLVFAEPAHVTAPHAPQTAWGDDNGVAFVFAQTYAAHSSNLFEGYVELRRALSADAFQTALLRCVGDDVRAALRQIRVTAYSEAEEAATATGLRRALRPLYNGEYYFMHGALCPAVARALRARIITPADGGAIIACGDAERGLLVRTLMRALALADALEC